jgi:hypothetical protein
MLLNADEKDVSDLNVGVNIVVSKIANTFNCLLPTCNSHTHARTHVHTHTHTHRERERESTSVCLHEITIESAK